MLRGALSRDDPCGADPAAVFNHINRFLCGHSEVVPLRATVDVPSALLGRDGTLEYIKAGHPSPLLLPWRGAVSRTGFNGELPGGPDRGR